MFFSQEYEQLRKDLNSTNEQIKTLQDIVFKMPVAQVTGNPATDIIHRQQGVGDPRTLDPPTLDAITRVVEMIEREKTLLGPTLTGILLGVIETVRPKHCGEEVQPDASCGEVQPDVKRPVQPAVSVAPVETHLCVIYSCLSCSVIAGAS